jgi:hypothetical protein
MTALVWPRDHYMIFRTILVESVGLVIGLQLTWKKQEDRIVKPAPRLAQTYAVVIGKGVF